MKQVISASRRTDIPAFYLPWFIQQIRQGFVDVPNPFDRKDIKRVSLAPQNVAWLVFWSRNYQIFLKNFQFFQPYRLFFHFTINPPQKILEPDMIHPNHALRQMEKLVNLYGPEVIIWRYDPLIFFRHHGQLESNHHLSVFKEYLNSVSQLGISNCYTSFACLYPKVKRRTKNLPSLEWVEIENRTRFNILHEMVELAFSKGVNIYSCSNDVLLRLKGIKKGHCINGQLLNKLGQEPVSEEPAPSRPDCGCTHSIDIGDYVKTRCKYHCLYCYARP